MPIFDYKGQDGRALVSQANDLMTYSYHGLDDGFARSYYQNGLGLGAPLTLIGGVLGILPGPISNTPDAEQNARDVIEAKGWTVLTKQQLNYADARVDEWGTFQGETLLEASAQCDVLGRYDAQGNLIQIGIAFRGTTGPRAQELPDVLLDVINDLMLTDPNYHYTDNAFGTLLAKVAAFAQSNGLTGKDILVTGHSLGGAAVNDLADISHDGAFPEYAFYADSNYIAQATPRIYDDPDVVLNYGHENDPVYRLIGENGPQLGVHDTSYDTTMDNIVTFNDYYASPLFPYVAFSILNLTNWTSHLPFFYTNSQDRILTSAFYDKMEMDSVIVIADLSNPMRANTWVEDKAAVTATGHAGKPVFFLGTDKADLLKSHGTSDFLEGRGGNDRFSLGGGQDVVLGGAGSDRVEFAGTLASYTIARTADGTIFVSEKTGDGGFDTLSSIETIQTQEWVTLLGIPLYQQSKNHTVGSLAYAETLEGNSGSNALTLVNNNGGWLFGRAGDDTLTGKGGRDHLDGGGGNDDLWGAGGDDVFVFANAFGDDVIHDFGGNDRLDFVGVDGLDNIADVLAAAQQVGSDVVINHGADSITLIGVDRASLNANDFLFA